MWSVSQKELEERLKKSLRKTPKRNYDLPIDYTISKYYDLAYKVSHNKYDNVYRACCPLCREGKSWGRKFRSYFIVDENRIYCHNCGQNLTPFNWIKSVSGMSDDEIFEEVEVLNTSINILEYSFEDTTVRENKVLPDDCINLFDSTQVSFYHGNEIVRQAMWEINQRRLQTAINSPDAIYISLSDYTHKNRLVIPFKDSFGKIVFYQSRKLVSWDLKDKYISKSGCQKTIAGMDKVDPGLDYVFIFEGPIDSFFIKNGIAVGGINGGYFKFTDTQEKQMEELRFFSKIWVVDSQWLDVAAREKTLKLLEQGECVFFWPEKWGKKYKDFNEMCVKCGIDGISPEFVKKNTLCGTEGVLKYKLLFGAFN